MMFKGVDFWPHGIRLPVMEWRRICIGISWIGALIALALILTKGLNFGIDFKGGSLFEVQAKSGSVDIADLRETIGRLNLGEVQIQGSGPTDALIRVAQQPGGEKEQQAAADKVKAAISDKVEVRRVEVVGAAVSNELKEAGFWACLTAIVGILIYVWFRFEWQFGVAAILALVHDTFITVGMFSLLQLDFGLPEVAALLTLAGYSINDTVVVFDRIRENLRRYKRMPLIELLNVSINETLSRTVLTASTTFLAVSALYVFGTEVIRGFSFAMLFGIVIGTWSSIFVASPFLLWIGIKRDWSEPAARPQGAKAQL
jgi:preprotein translocase SecF subunit